MDKIQIYPFDTLGNVLGYTNDCTGRGDYTTSQAYTYDNLYQLVKAEGHTVYNPYKGGVVPVHDSTYTQTFAFDILGNMTKKLSEETVYPQKSIGDELNYEQNYAYAEGFAHGLDHISDKYYRYDLNGNVTAEQFGAFADGGASGTGGIIYSDGRTAELPGSGSSGGSSGTGGTSSGSGDDGDDDGWDWDDDWQGGSGVIYSGGGTGSGSGSGSSSSGNNGPGTSGSAGSGTSGNGGSDTTGRNRRTYKWNERNQLVRSEDVRYTVDYVYGADGNRTNKYTSSGETIYFSKLWTWYSGKSADSQTSKHIYLGETRILTKMNSGEGHDTYSEEMHKQYYYHSDHLGSAQLISDYRGNEYQRVEYTPYGETWVERIEDSDYVYMPYKFTGKELDEETGLYYYGARYLDSKASIWISVDPALKDYISKNYDGASGGIYNIINFNLYHYGKNNPMRYVDPTGREDVVFNTFPSKWDIRTKFTTFVSVLILRPHSGYGDKFDSLRIVRTYSDTAGFAFYCDMVGANAVDADFAKKYDGMTLPDGIYYYTVDNLTLNDDGTYSSNHYKNVYRLQTLDENIPESIRAKINDDMYLSHPNQFKDADTEYNTSPRSAGCNIVRGQEAQDKYMDILKLATSPEDVSIRIKSGDKE